MTNELPPKEPQSRAVIVDGVKYVTGYVRITFLDAGDKRRRSVWANDLRPSRAAGLVSFRVLDDEGAPTSELVLARRSELTVREAWMNLHYCEMQLRPATVAAGG
jgi:hypothetical protein